MTTMEAIEQTESLALVVPPDMAKTVIKLIATGKVPGVVIRY